MHILTVDASEQGIKLIVFLARRLQGETPQGELHRWIRTGQVRVNGSRAKAFSRLQAGDFVRLPPFAAPMATTGQGEIGRIEEGKDLGHGVIVLLLRDDVIALEKPAGLPTQPGTGHDVSVAAMLRDYFSGGAYCPAPAHRLDKSTSGILLAGLTHEAQQRLHALFPSTAKGGETGLRKVYLAWVSGTWPHTSEQELADSLRKEADPLTGRERVLALSGEDAATGKEARSRVSLLETRETPRGTASLLRILLETGRTHQIRVQLASRGHPVIGDGKYGGQPHSPMLLHAQSLVFPWRGERVTLVSWPKWPDPFSITV